MRMMMEHVLQGAEGCGGGRVAGRVLGRGMSRLARGNSGKRRGMGQVAASRQREGSASRGAEQA